MKTFGTCLMLLKKLQMKKTIPIKNQKYDPSIYYPMMAMVQVTTYHSLCLDKALASNKQEPLRGVKRCIFGELGDKSKM